MKAFLKELSVLAKTAGVVAISWLSGVLTLRVLDGQWPGRDAAWALTGCNVATWALLNTYETRKSAGE